MNYYATASFLNLLCYVLWGVVRYLGFHNLAHVALLVSIASLYFTVRLLMYYRRHKSEAPQGMPFRIGFSFFCIAFFCVCYVMEYVWPTL